MLPDYFRFRLGNDTGQIMTYSGADVFTLQGKFWKIDAGALVWSAEIALLNAGTDVGVAEGLAGTEQDNTTDKWHGVHLLGVASTTNASASGQIIVGMEWPTSGAGGTYPSDAANYNPLQDLVQLGIIPLIGAVARSRNFKA